jgi:hypothetical protein
VAFRRPKPAGHAPLERGRRPDDFDGPTSARAPDRTTADEKAVLDLQQTAGNAAVSSMLAPTPGDLVRSVVDSPGRSLDSDTSSFVRSATGHDTSGIRLHEGPEAAAAAKSVQADMFASGSHLVAPRGLDVTTREGAFKTLHEVHHIMSQQAKGPVDGTETEDGLKISDPSDRFEQEADRVAAEGVSKHFDKQG